jgi:hypothetical protein
MSVTCDPNDPRLGHGVDTDKVPQNEVYLVDCDVSKGYIRPLRTTYIHRGIKIRGKIRPLDDKEKAQYASEGYVAFDEYPESERPLVGRYLTQKEFDSIKGSYIGGCGHTTTMGLAIAETYARKPKFYGATYCVNCERHLPVSEFVWAGDETIVGS